MLRRIVAIFAVICAGCAASNPLPPSTMNPKSSVAPPAANDDFPRGDPLATGLDASALQKFLEQAEDTHSDQVIVLRDGKIVVEKDFTEARGLVETMSVTKSIVGLLIGQLIDAHKIESVDVALSAYFPEWKDDAQKSKITLRHVLTQTSGIQDRSDTKDIYASQDFVKLAVDAPIAEEPGSTFRYNNKATNLLAAVVERASGVKMDEWARVHLFEPLAIRDYEWMRDPAGNPESMSGLRVHPIDLAKIGQLVLNHGTWNGKSVVSAAWIDMMCSVQSPNAPYYGFLWWLVSDKQKIAITDGVIAKWRSAGVSEDFIAKVSPMRNRALERPEFFAALADIFGGKPGLETWYDATWRRGLPDGEVVGSTTIGVRADGWLGNYIVVIPRDRLVAVRMRRTPVGPDAQSDTDNKKYGYFDFTRDVQALVKH
jgi:CubicO group peptidase (beta-lactamase class C family)